MKKKRADRRRFKQALKRRERELVQSGVKECCARLLALQSDVVDGETITLHCPVCDEPLGIRYSGKSEDAEPLLAEIERLVISSGAVCTCKPVEIVASTEAKEGEVCPCGKPNFRLRLIPVVAGG
jgi:hypothetical protein